MRALASGAGLGVVVGGAVVVLNACQPPPAQKVQQTEKTIREESTPDKLVARGKLFAHMGDLTRASQYLEAAIDEGANEREVIPLLMRIYIRDSRFRSAVASGERYLDHHPRDFALRYLVGTLQSALGNKTEAKAQFERVLLTKPDHAPAHYALGVELREGNDWVGADYHFRKYLEIDPSGKHAEEARASLLKSVP